jgi:hypothetical protein
MEKVMELNVQIEKLDGSTITVLQGNAIPPKDPIKVEISGTIEAL